MKDNIIKNLENLPMLKDVDGSILTRAKYQVLNSERLDEDSKELIYSNPWIVLDGSDYDVIQQSKIEFWAYSKNYPMGRFFNEKDCIEYVLFKIGLI